MDARPDYYPELAGQPTILLSEIEIPGEKTRVIRYQEKIASRGNVICHCCQFIGIERHPGVTSEDNEKMTSSELVSVESTTSWARHLPGYLANDVDKCPETAVSAILEMYCGLKTLVVYEALGHKRPS